MKKLPETIKLGLALCLATIVPLAVADNGSSETTNQHFGHLDKDKNGSVSETEYREFMEASFTQLDTDNKGSLSLAETEKVLTVEEFALVDKDKNGEVTREEFMLQVMSDFQRFDRNKDGQLQH